MLDIHSGKVIKQLECGDSLAVLFNPKRNEIYISQRESGKVISLDGTTYALKKQWDILRIQTACCSMPRGRRCL